MTSAVSENPKEFTEVSGLPDRVGPKTAADLWKMWMRDAYANDLSPETFANVNKKIDEVVAMLKGKDGKVDRVALLKHLGKMNSAIESKLNPNATSNAVIEKLDKKRFG